MYIDVSDVSVLFKNKNTVHKVLDNVSLGIKKGEFICLLGPSGCGKSTLLNVMAGFIKPDQGFVAIDNVQVEKPLMQYQTIFQQYGLLPWRSVEGNVALGLEQMKVPKKERKDIVNKYLELVGLGGCNSKRTSELSGGMQQRVAIARALAVDSKVLFMDEPFGALDTITRMKLQEDIKEICQKTEKTIIFVTHDIDEAVYLSDRAVIMSSNPGMIKGVVNFTDIQRKDRTSDDFIIARDKIFEILNMKKNDTIEYYL